MADHKFWWVCGTHAAPHLSDATTVAFSAVLVMPSATTSADWSQEPAHTALVDQVDCENQFGDWLAPWQGGITWKLYGKSGDTIWEIGTKRSVAPAIQKTDADEIAARASKRLHAHVRGSGKRAMTMETSDDGQVLSYPIVARGVSQVPAPISDTVLSTSCVFEVLRVDIGGPAEMVVALPTFQLEGKAFGPAAKGHKGCKEYPAFEFAYDGVQEKVLGNDNLAFSACVSNAVPRAEFTWKNMSYPARRVEIRNGKPMRQVYASLSREFNPLKLWLAAMNGLRVEAIGVKRFTQTFVSFLGGGEDELDATGRAIGSIYELVLPEDHYQRVIGALAPHRDAAANMMLEKFHNFQDAPKLLESFSTAAGSFGLKDAQAAADALAKPPKADLSKSQQAEAALAHARTLSAAFAAPDPSGRALWAVWLAVVVDKVASDAQASKELLAQALAAFRDERVAAPPVMEDDVLRLMNGQIDHATTFWTKVHAAPNPKKGLEDTRDELIKNIEDRGLTSLIEPEISQARTALKTAYEAAVKLIGELLANNKAEGDDPPLQLRYAASPSSNEQEIRGCILALRAGLPQGGGAVDWIEPQWITNFEANHPEAGTRIADAKGKAVTFCDTQGATRSDGLDEQEVTYDGRPLFAAEEVGNKHVGKGPELLQPTPPSKLPARLGFGMHYEAICGTVDNAGAIVEEGLRDASAVGVPVDAVDPAIFDALAKDGFGFSFEPFRLLSRQPPGAPVIGETKDHGVASETFTSEVLLNALAEGAAAAPGLPTSTSEVLLGELTRNRPAARIAVVYGAGATGTDWSRTSDDKQTVKVYAPTVGPKFIERWLSYDHALPEKDTRRWNRVRALADTDIDGLIKESAKSPTTQVTGGKQTQVGVTHPAVKQIKVLVTWYGAAVKALPSIAAEPVPIPLSHLDAGGKNWLRDEAIAIELKQLATDDAAERKVVSDPANKKLTLEIPRGLRACVEVLSVVDGTFLETGENGRFNADALAGSDGPYVKNGSDFVTRQPPSFWVESLPAVPTDKAPFNIPEPELKLVYPLAPGDAPAMSVQLANTDRVGAAWVRGFALEQKRWQWTSYPVKFPISNDLAPWLALYTGAEDSMPRLPNGNFVSSFTDAWYLKSALLRPVPLPAPRAANHMGLIVTPIPRFASLLSKEVLKRCDLIHLFAVVPASPRETTKRLQPPVWMEAIPLPHSVDAKGMASTPANLAVFRDAVYDTADTAVLGGIAEKLELDVPSTWEPDRLEIGVNPIFHAAPRRNNAPWLTLELPFGLSYDRVVGGRPAQTAAVIRVHGGEGKWVLAKCRLRRLVDPELVAGSEMAFNKNVATLNLRQVEDGWIPEDVAIYCTKPLAKIDFGAGCTLDLPPAAATIPSVCLVTWHRERWGAAKPTWRPLVKVYQTNKDTRIWNTPPNDSRAVGDKDFESVGGGQIELKLDVEATVRRLAVSDYTESRWLTFIGSFEREAPVPKDVLKIQLSGKAFVLTTTAPKLPQLFKAGELRSSLLLVFEPRRDLMRGEFAQDGGELRGVYAMTEQPESDTGPATFDIALLEAKGNTKGCNAVLIQLQRHNVEVTAPEWSMAANKWPEIVDKMFPTQKPDGTGAEVIFRLLPEFIGEIKID